MSKGCLSQKHWPKHVGLCLVKKSKEKCTACSLALVGLPVHVLGFFTGIFVELGFAHLVGVERGALMP